MGRPHRRVAVWVLCLALAGCSPVGAGPELPRPPQPAPTTTTLPPTTTTTLDPVEVAAGECETDFCLVYRLDPDAVWSDGVPVTSADFVNTFEVNANPVGGVTPGYEQIVSVEPLDEVTVRVTFGQPYGGWQGLFARLLPAHVAEGDVVPTSGAFRFAEWVPGDRIVLVGTERWHEAEPLSGAPWGDVERVTFVFIPEVADMVTALESGEVDVIAARATPEAAQRVRDAGLGLAIAPGPFWEHIDFHHQDGMLAQRWVREVFDLAIDRQAILDSTVRLIDPESSGLDNTIWMGNDVRYEAHYADRHDPVAAEQILIDNGCTRSGSTYVCGEREMSFVWTSTNDDPARQATFDLVAADMAAVGIELVPDLRRPSEFVTREHLFGGPDAWQLINFSWRAPVDPGPNDATYLCGDSDLNVNRYCSGTVESLILEAQTIVEPDIRAEAYNAVDRAYLDDLAVIPLYQKPNLMAWRPELAGPAPNYTYSTDVWNLGAWVGKPDLVVAIADEPSTLDPLSRDDEAAAIVLSALMYGAFGMDPSHQYLPVMVESVEIVAP